MVGSEATTEGRNFIWDLHAVVGTWVVIFYLILACTGLTWSYGWWRDGMYKVLGVERPQPEMQANGGRGEGGDRGPRGERGQRGEGREEAGMSQKVFHVHWIKAGLASVLNLQANIQL